MAILTEGVAKDPRQMIKPVVDDVDLPPDLARIFSMYDRNGNGSIDRAEAAYMLADMGILDGINNEEAGQLLEREFRRIDFNGDNSVRCILPSPTRSTYFA